MHSLITVTVVFENTITISKMAIFGSLEWDGGKLDDSPTLSILEIKQMKNQRNPQIVSVGSGVQKRLLNFSRALSKNDQDVYEYILLMVRGDFKTQEDSCDCIFAHLRNILSTEMNTNVLKYASRFITTLLLIGNLHIYEKFVAYLLPVFKEKIGQDYERRMRPVWPVQLFCKELLFIMAMWLPNDFYDPARPSPFAEAVQQLGIRCEEFKFMNVDKIIIAYRIIKALGLDEAEENCHCQNCKLRAQGKLGPRGNNSENASNKHMRERLYVLQSKSHIRDGLFETGFQISLQEEMSQLENMMEQKLKSYGSRPPQESLIFYRLREKMEVLEDDIQLIKTKYDKRPEAQRKTARTQGQRQRQPEEGNQFQTPKKVRKTAEIGSTNDRSPRHSKKMVSPSTNLQTMRSLPNLQLLPLEHQFAYKQYDFFERVLKLSGNQLQAFKNSLLSFQERIYLKKTAREAIYCLAIAKGPKIKIRVKFQGEDDAVNGYSVDLDNPALSYHFNQQKYQYTLKISHYFEPLKLVFSSPNSKETFVLPIGHIKLLEPLPDSAVETEKLTFKLTKIVKLQNRHIPTYEHLVTKFCHLQKLLQHTRSAKITRIFQGQKLKKKLQRRYLLFETELYLEISNNQTQYVDVEVSCLDKNIHRRNACELLKEIIYICSCG